MKNDTATFTVLDMENIYKSIINRPNQPLTDPHKPVLDIIYELADETSRRTTSRLNSKARLSSPLPSG
jgi:hypothetical protein